LTDQRATRAARLLHDTLGPAFEVVLNDSVTIRVTFDRGIDSSQAIPPAVHDQGKDRRSSHQQRALGGRLRFGVRGSRTRAHRFDVARGLAPRGRFGLASRDTARPASAVRLPPHVTIP